MTRLKIALITPGFSADEGDWCIPALLNMVRVLAREHEVHVFTLRYPHRRAVYAVYGATVYSFGGAEVAGVRRIPLLVRALWGIMREGRHSRFDIIHGLWADEPGLLAVLAGRLLGVPALVSLLGGELEQMAEINYGHQLSRAGRRMIAFSLQRAACVTVGSRHLLQRALAYVQPERLVEMPLGVATTCFYPGPSTEATPLQGEIKLLHVASLVPVKDQAVLLRALAGVIVKQPGVHLHIVGSGPLRVELERLATDLGVAARVTFHGEVGHERLPGYYRAADLFVLSSRYESQGMVALEAAACGLPIIGTE
ncbi:MAG: glycosyltransferase, partial [Ardenticatenaceae bacterium]